MSPRLLLSALLAIGLLWMSPSAAQSLSRPLDETMLQSWIERLPNSPEDPEDVKAHFALVDLLNQLNDMIQTTDDIATFRHWIHDDVVVQRLIPLAAGRFPETRIPATLVLGNVVDTTNVCYVLAYLAQNPDLGINGRFNLLQVVLQVATYAETDSGEWIAAAVKRVSADVAAIPDSEKTQALLGQISEALSNRKLGLDTSLEQIMQREGPTAVAKYEACKATLTQVGLIAPPG